MNNDRTKNLGHVEMSNGPSFNTRTPWTVDPTDEDYAIADAREEAWIKGQIVMKNLPFTYEGIRSYISRNLHVLSAYWAARAIDIVQDPDQTLYKLFSVAEQIHKKSQEAT